MSRSIFPFRLAVASLLIAVCGLNAHADTLYKPGSYQALTGDVRARNVGDLITVMVYENASASSTLDTSAARDASVGFDLRGPGKSFAGGVNTNNSTDGRGRTQREGKVLAQITVMVREVGKNGDLLIVGEQMLEINNEKQQISVEGRIRPQDVGENNTVLSTRIANARIRYSGQGDLADRQRPAWWQRFITLFGV